eukprot:m.30539 g.30539  ORF g.30539 m.30539 type:complete len:904 (+) comp31353_c0_seq2:169-2880(+)
MFLFNLLSSIVMMAAFVKGSDCSGQDKPYGSSSFGTWLIDSFGLPAYQFTGALPKPGQIGPKVPMIAHRVGNDRIEAAVLTNGEVSFRQDEGCPKLFNDYDGENGQFRGGIGFLADHSTQAVVLSSRAINSLNPEIANFSLVFGVNYVLKSTWNEEVAMEHRLFSPFGDLPLVYSQVNITNLSKVRKNMSYVEYWGGKIRLLNCRHKPSGLFNHSFTFVQRDNTSGLQDSMTAFPPHESEGIGPKPSYYGQNPPPVFLYSLNEDQPSSYTTNGRMLFPNADPLSPNILSGLDNDTTIRDNRGIMALEQRILLDSAETVSLCFVYGYNPESSLLLNKVLSASNCQTHFTDSAEKWKALAPTINLPGELDWVQRELTWHTYMLRAALTFDSFYEEHMLNQNGNYLYIDEMQAAPRDPLTHVMGFLYGHGQNHSSTVPSSVPYVKEVIRYSLKEKRLDGSTPWGQCAFGEDGFAYLDPSDLELQVIFTTMNYVLTRNDYDFLKEVVFWNGTNKTVGEMLWESYDHLKRVIRFGEHGLILLHTADHNDGILGTLDIKGENRTIAVQRGESVMNSALGAYTLGLYEEVLRYTGSTSNSSDVQETVAALRKAVSQTWTGQWFKRAYLGDESRGLGWRGDDQDGVMWTETQSWALLGGVPQMELNRTASLVDTIYNLSVKPSPIGPINAGPKRMEDKGMGYGGVWYCGTLALISAFGYTGYVDMALEVFLKSSLATHAFVYPDVWFGVTGGSDCYNSILADDPSSSRLAESFPVLNSWVHTVPLVTLINLAGIEFRPGLIVIRPQLQLRTYTIHTALIGVEKSDKKTCHYSGHFHPDLPGKFTFKVYLPPEDFVKCKRILVNDNNWENLGNYVIEEAKDAAGQILTKPSKFVQFSSFVTSSEAMIWKMSS